MINAFLFTHNPTLRLLEELWQVLLPFMMTLQTPRLRLFWTGYGIKVIGCFIFADTLYSFTKLLVKYPPMGLITKVSKMLPYSTTAQKLRTYWASGVLLSLLWTSSKLYSTTTTLNIIREKLKWLQHHILIMRNGLLDLLFAFSTKQSSVL